MPRIFPLTATLLLAATSLAPAQSFSPPPGPPVRIAPAGDAFVQAAERLIARGIDAQRRKFAPDAPSLAGNRDLADIARRRSSDMAGGAPFAHEDAQGRFVAADLVRARFGPYGSIGENIMEMGSSRAFSPETFAQMAVEGWMKSPGHRKNILDPDYNSSGIGVAIQNGTAYATQVFFGPPKHAARR
jgi:uncharacterized protein YkwD